MISPGAEDVLILIDVQNDFCPGGALAVPDGDAVVPIINRLTGVILPGDGGVDAGGDGAYHGGEAATSSAGG